MKLSKLFFALPFALAVGCANNSVDNNNVVVNTISIQELDNAQYIEEQEQKGNKNLVKKYDLLDDNFTIIKDSVFNGCTDHSTVRLDKYSIKNTVRNTSLDKVLNRVTIYQKGENDTCKRVLVKADSVARNVVEHKGKLYIEIQKASSLTSGDEVKSSIYKLEGNKLQEVIKNIQPLNNMVSVNDQLFISHGARLDIVGDDGKRTNLKKEIKLRVWSISSQGNTLNVLFKDTKTGDLSVNRYLFDKDLKINNIEDMTLEESKNIIFEREETKEEIDSTVSFKNQDYVIHDSKMICKNDYSSCKTTIIEGETIQNVIGDLVIYNSDRSYISHYKRDTKQVISSLLVKYASLSKDRELLLKIYDEAEKDHEYFKYIIKKGY